MQGRFTPYGLWESLTPEASSRVCRSGLASGELYQKGLEFETATADTCSPFLPRVCTTSVLCAVGFFWWTWVSVLTFCSVSGTYHISNLLILW